VATVERREFLAVLAGTAAAALAPAPARAANARVTLEVARLADNGHSVPIRVLVDSPMTAADHVKTITLVSERNPRPIMAVFHLGPRTGKAEVATRVRLNGSQRVTAIARLSDGSEVSAVAEVEVTESACLDAG
jgi:sulfur-oxidizing protein SoxY